MSVWELTMTAEENRDFQSQKAAVLVNSLTALCSWQTLIHEFCTTLTPVLLNWQFSPFGSRIPLRMWWKLWISFTRDLKIRKWTHFPCSFGDSRTPAPQAHVCRSTKLQVRTHVVPMLGQYENQKGNNQHLPDEVLKRVVLYAGDPHTSPERCLTDILLQKAFLNPSKLWRFPFTHLIMVTLKIRQESWRTWTETFHILSSKIKYAVYKWREENKKQKICSNFKKKNQIWFYITIFPCPIKF